MNDENNEESDFAKKRSYTIPTQFLHTSDIEKI